MPESNTQSLEPVRTLILQAVWAGCVDKSDGHFVFVGQIRRAFETVENYLGLKSLTLNDQGQLNHRLKKMVRFEFEWLKNKYRANEFSFYEAYTQRLKTTRGRKKICGNPGCKKPVLYFADSFCPFCRYHLSQGKVANQTTSQVCEGCKLAGIVPGEIYCLQCLS